MLNSFSIRKRNRLCLQEVFLLGTRPSLLRLQLLPSSLSAAPHGSFPTERHSLPALWQTTNPLFTPTLTIVCHVGQSRPPVKAAALPAQLSQLAPNFQWPEQQRSCCLPLKEGAKQPDPATALANRADSPGCFIRV